MKTTDARKLSADALTDLRQRAVLLVQKGETPDAVARALGVTRKAVYRWVALAAGPGGMKALQARKRGGRPRLLSAEIMEWIYIVVTLKDPRQLKFAFALWTCDMLAQAVEAKFDVHVSRWTIMRALKRMGLTPQRPMWRAYQQDPVAVRRWLRSQFPRIRARAKKLGAEIYFGDEAGVRSDHHAGRTWSPRGETPIVAGTGARFGLNLISAVSPRGHLRFMVVEGPVRAKEFIDFLRRLIHGATAPIFLIVDQHPAHKAKTVKQFVADQGGRLHLYFLPPYSPERNPDEYVWNDLKHHVGRRGLASPALLKAAVTRRLRHLAKSPEKVRGFFRTKFTRYAA